MKQLQQQTQRISAFLLQVQDVQPLLDILRIVTQVTQFVAGGNRIAGHVKGLRVIGLCLLADVARLLAASTTGAFSIVQASFHKV